MRFSAGAAILLLAACTAKRNDSPQKPSDISSNSIPVNSVPSVTVAPIEVHSAPQQKEGAPEKIAILFGGNCETTGGPGNMFLDDFHRLSRTFVKLKWKTRVFYSERSLVPNEERESLTRESGVG